MCTTSWFTHSDGYELFFNRDERLSRQRAQLPSQHQGEGVQYLAPIDTDAGGTWIATNHYGITVCLLNHYQFQQIKTYKNWTSRGNIVRDFAVLPSLKIAEKYFESLDLDDYRAFRMFMIQADGHNCLFVWDGRTARIEQSVATPKSSSSVDAQQVKALRKGLFAELQLAESTNRQAFIDFHASHIPSHSKNSVCMHREDAKTVSFTHVVVNTKGANKGIGMAYADGSPCESPLGAPITMEMVSFDQSPINSVIEPWQARMR